MLKYLKTIKELKSNFKLVDAVVAAVSFYAEKEKIFFPKLGRNLFLRRNTKDFETFEEVFIKSIYNINLPIKPTNIVDAGANVGLSTLFFKLKYPNATVDAVEIESQNCEMIKKNTAGLSGVQIHQKGLFSKKTFFTIIDPYNATNSFQIQEVADQKDATIESITLENLFEQHNWTTLDLLKIDIEGAEKSLFSSNYQKWLPTITVSSHLY